MSKTGAALYIESTTLDGFLTLVNEKGDVQILPKNQGLEQKWVITPTEKGYSLIISKNNYCLIIEEQGNTLKAVPLDDIKGHISSWKVTKDDFISFPTYDGKKYLWIATNKVYGTPDAYIAECWKFNVIEEKPPLQEERFIESNTNNSVTSSTSFLIIGIFLLLLILSALMLYRKRK